MHNNPKRKKWNVRAIRDMGDFWEVSNSITQGQYARALHHYAVDQILNDFPARDRHKKKKLTHFMPTMDTHGYDTFTLEGGEKILRGDMESLLEFLGEAQKVQVENAVFNFTQKGMKVVGICKGLAGQWQMCGFVVLG